MALVSPGVEVTVIDESTYVPAATNSVPYILIATAQDKVSGTSALTAVGTTAAEANKLNLVTSQRDLATLYGNPFFYKTSAGTPINGYELNEYGLLAAFSVLGISNRAYVQRADVNLTELTASLVRPTGDPADGTYWLDTATTLWGINQWNQTTGAFTVATPIVITSTQDLTGGIPSDSVGSIGNYAVVATNANNPVYYKNLNNDWVLVGSDAWKNSWTTVQGTQSVSGAALTVGNTIIINGTTVAVPAGQTLASLVGAINTAAIAGVTAETNLTRTSNQLWLYGDSAAEADGSSADGGVINIDPASTAGLLTTLGITAGSNLTPALQQSANFTVPRWRTTDTSPRPTGSVWNKTTSVNQGANIVVKQYDATLDTFATKAAPIYQNDQSAIAAYDPTGGGKNIPAGSLYTQYNVSPEDYGPGYNNTFTLKVFERIATGVTTIVGDDTTPVFVSTETFTIQTSQLNSTALTTAATVTLTGTTAADFVAAVSAAAVPNVLATVTSTGAIAFTQLQGGVIVLKDISGTPVADAGFNTTVDGVRTAGEDAGLILSDWVALTYTADSVAPDQDPADGRLWYYSAVNQVDIMINDGTSWVGYQTVTNDVRGYNLTQTDPAGPIVATTAPTEQSDGTALVYGDLWVDTSNLEIYPQLYRWELVDGVDQWVLIDNTDQTTENGILFADARWAPNGTTDPITGNIPTIVSLLTSSYLDLDAPDYAVYPTGTLLWNTRRNGYNVKSFQVDYFNATDFSIDAYSNVAAYAVGDKVLYNGVVYVCILTSTGNLPTNGTYWSLLETNAWVNASGNRADGSPNMGRLAQRAIIVAAMKSAIDTQETLREEQNQFNLIACPGYPELITNMVALNNERTNTAFIVGDTPMRLGPTGNDIVDFATNNGGLGTDAADGLSISDPYVGVFYPSCQTVDTTGSVVVQPPSHMMLRTIIRSDEVAFPWFAPAGTLRGLVDNATRLGYINAATSEFIPIATGQGVRDVLYTNKINPITFIPGTGIVNYGNKTISATPSALDRINVARLVAFLRLRLEEIGNNFLFEPNDALTRSQITNVIESLMQDLRAKRALYDYLIVCDESNNTPARIDANELYVDIAIEPVKAVEFIYIPVRIKNTGEIAAGNPAANAV
jgi:hypothetical protein